MRSVRSRCENTKELVSFTPSVNNRLHCLRERLHGDFGRCIHLRMWTFIAVHGRMRGYLIYTQQRASGAKGLTGYRADS